jgi:site-specific DNA-methyltransferase (adenine-specific)
VNIEDAGFEIRDIVSWIYGTGFPKSHNIGKAVDKIQGNEREVIKDYQPFGRENRSTDGKAKFGVEGWETGANPTETKGSSPYEGWGTALKPAQEFWTLARKPLSEKTIAANVLKWGTGGINIDGCRVGSETITQTRTQMKTWREKEGRTDIPESADNSKTQTQGRFPANFLHDGSEEAIEGMQVKGDDKSRYFYTAKASKSERNKGLEGFEPKRSADRNIDDGVGGDNPRNRSNTDKVNHHPTVKPISLMQYLCRLITPKDGTVLDPFMGSGTTGIGAKLEGFDFIGIELDAEYCKIAEARIEAHEPNPQKSLYE